MRRQYTAGGGTGAVALATLAQAILRLPPERRPPITLFIIAVQVCVFFTVENRGRLVRTFAFNAERILQAGILSSTAWLRMLGSQWVHLSAAHLGYNMISLLWKGVHLEPDLGTVRYACMVICLSVLTPLTTIALCIAAAEVFGSTDWLIERAVGFSGIIFAIKTVLNSSFQSQSSTTYYGVSIPTRHAAWAELLITFFIPGTSFVGHLGGILAGVLWCLGGQRIVFSLVDQVEAFIGRRANAEDGGSYSVPHTRDYTLRGQMSGSRIYGSGISGYRNGAIGATGQR